MKSKKEDAQMQKQKTEMIPIDKIRLDGNTQSRGRLDEDTAAEYAEQMRAGDVFPAVTVFYDGTDYWMADGFHRGDGRKQAGFDAIEAIVQEGTRLDAVLFAAGANAKHGLSRSKADRRNSVKMLLAEEEYRNASVNWLAEKACVSRDLVDSVIAELGLERTATLAGKDGKQRPSHYGQHADQQVEATETLRRDGADCQVAETHPDTKTSDARHADNQHADSTEQCAADDVVGYQSWTSETESTGSGDSETSPDADADQGYCDSMPAGPADEFAGGSVVETPEPANVGAAPMSVQEPELGLVDQLGRPAPERLREVFGKLDIIREFRQDIINLRTKWNRLIETPVFARVRKYRQDFERNTEHCRSLVNFDIPHAVCPHCKGDDKPTCRPCGGLGWFNENQWENYMKHSAEHRRSVEAA
jgi:hypothetical protein